MRKLLTAIAAGAGALALAGPASAATVVVTPTDMDGWSEDNTGTADVALVTGPGTPPAGTGSAQVTVTNGDDIARFRNTQWSGKELKDLTALSYWTYVAGGTTPSHCTADSAGGEQAVYLILHVDINSNGVADHLLFFEPTYSGNVACDAWQQWDAKSGKWYALDATTFATVVAPPGITLTDYLAANPTATIVNAADGKGGVRLNAGAGAPDWNNFNGNADKLTIAFAESTTYDFEPTAPPSPPRGRDKVNPAEACRAELTRLGEAAFIAFYAPANHPTKRNAFGKCVSTMAGANRADNGLTVHRLVMTAAAECKADGKRGKELGRCVAGKVKAQVTKLSKPQQKGKGRGRKP